MELFYLHPMYKDFVFIYFKNLSIFIYFMRHQMMGMQLIAGLKVFHCFHLLIFFFFSFWHVYIILTWFVLFNFKVNLFRIVKLCCDVSNTHKPHQRIFQVAGQQIWQSLVNFQKYYSSYILVFLIILIVLMHEICIQDNYGE